MYMFPFLININMIEVIKSEDGDSTPILYNFYDDQYEYNELLKQSHKYT